MKVPRTKKRYCPYCKKHTVHKVNLAAASRQRGALKKGSIVRAMKRGRGVGTGNLGKWGSKPPVTRWKRKKKNIKKTNLTYTCEICKKTTVQRWGKRTGKVVFAEEKK